MNEFIFFHPDDSTVALTSVGDGDAVVDVDSDVGDFALLHQLGTELGPVVGRGRQQMDCHGGRLVEPLMKNFSN